MRNAPRNSTRSVPPSRSGPGSLGHDRDEAAVGGHLDDRATGRELDGEVVLVDRREFRVTVRAHREREGERLVGVDLRGWFERQTAEARREIESRAVVGQRLAYARGAAAIRLAGVGETVVVGDEADRAVLAADVDPVRAERGRAVEIVAVVVDAAVRPAQPPVGIERDEPAVARSEVDVILGIDGGRGADRRERVEGPDALAVLGVERVHGSVRRGRDDASVRELRRARVDVVARREAPDLPAVLLSEGAHVAVEAADHDGAVGARRGEQRRADDAAEPAAAPDLLAALRIEREQVAQRDEHAAEEDPPRPRVDGRERPAQLVAEPMPAFRSGVAVDPVVEVVVVAGEQRAVGEHRDVALPPVHVEELDVVQRLDLLGRVRAEPPQLAAALAVDGVQVRVARGHVDAPAVVEQRRGVDDLAGEELPFQRAVGADRVEDVVGRADVRGALAVDHGRAEDALAGREGPGPRIGARGPHGAATALPRVGAELRPRARRIERHVVADARGVAGRVRAVECRIRAQRVVIAVDEPRRGTDPSRPAINATIFRFMGRGLAQPGAQRWLSPSENQRSRHGASQSRSARVYADRTRCRASGFRFVRLFE